jgi:hypothetical protein
MTNRDHLICLAAATALVAFSGIARADEYSMNETARSEIQGAPMTCAQARAFAWFKHQLELGEGVSDNAIDEPAECQREYVAKSPDSDAYDESK